MESENATIQQEPAAAGTVSLPAEDFGRKTLDEAETFADTILKRIRVKDAEGIKSDLTSLLSGAELLTSGKKDDRGLLATLPVVGKLFEASGIASPEAETLMKSIGVISGKLDAAQFGLIKDSATLETLAAKTKRSARHSLSCWRPAPKRSTPPARQELRLTSAALKRSSGDSAAYGMKRNGWRLRSA